MDTLVRRAIDGKSPKFIELYLKTQGKLTDVSEIKTKQQINIAQDGVTEDLLADIDAILNGDIKYDKRSRSSKTNSRKLRGKTY